MVWLQRCPVERGVPPRAWTPTAVVIKSILFVSHQTGVFDCSALLKAEPLHTSIAHWLRRVQSKTER